MSKKMIPLSEWAKKNHYSPRHARRLANAGLLPVKNIPIYIMGIREDFKIKTDRVREKDDTFVGD